MMSEIHIHTFQAENRLETIDLLATSLGITHAKCIKADTRKPYLEQLGGKRSGLAITHVRQSSVPFSLAGVSTNPNIGMDAEVLPRGAGGAIFLRSILTPDEAPLISHLQAHNLDASLFLWVGKEAALKASGIVMVDPRDMAITPLGGNRARVATSRMGSVWVTPAIITYHTFFAPHSGEQILLALATVELPEIEKNISINAGKLQGLRPMNIDSP